MSDTDNKNTNYKDAFKNAKTNLPATPKKERKANKYLKEFGSMLLDYGKNDILKNTIVPQVKDLLWDIGSRTLHDALYKHDPNMRSTRDNNYISYNECSNRRNRSSQARPKDNPQSYTEIGWTSRAAAKRALNELDDRIREYGQAEVGYYFQLAGKTPVWTVARYGWVSRNIVNSPIELASDGLYYIHLPQPISIG